MSSSQCKQLSSSTAQWHASLATSSLSWFVCLLLARVSGLLAGGSLDSVAGRALAWLCFCCLRWSRIRSNSFVSLFHLQNGLRPNSCLWSLSLSHSLWLTRSHGPQGSFEGKKKKKQLPVLGRTTRWLQSCAFRDVGQSNGSVIPQGLWKSSSARTGRATISPQKGPPPMETIFIPLPSSSWSQSLSKSLPARSCWFLPQCARQPPRWGCGCRPGVFGCA